MIRRKLVLSFNSQQKRRQSIIDGYIPSPKLHRFDHFQSAQEIWVFDLHLFFHRLNWNGVSLLRFLFFGRKHRIFSKNWVRDNLSGQIAKLVALKPYFYLHNIQGSEATLYNLHFCVLLHFEKHLISSLVFDTQCDGLCSSLLISSVRHFSVWTSTTGFNYSKLSTADLYGIASRADRHCNLLIKAIILEGERSQETKTYGTLERERVSKM